MEQLITIYKILSDETRLRIIVLLAQKELCVCELSDILAVSQPKISKNLGKLRDLNLVKSERKERFVFYKLKIDNPILNRTIKSILDNLSDYPQLVLDKSRHIDNENLLNQCCNHRTSKL
ncbi:ArsR/SmtB family transcription factor [Acetobacterium bakii]|uniref:Transcriptional regulator n=1 Tax=Acetobacterium bakii TaxID=52689 RepID=A0A0L6U1C8_9FIRM|nr:metalloregulator ArsR/SmtB family transcription factor [Acetobacterium bakii]KNZ41605.1 transcriptional regulator [Acetobacterium bakii]